MGSASPSVFSTSVVPAAPEDPLFGLAQAFRNDPSDKKVDLVIGAYRDDNAKPWILPVVRKVCGGTAQGDDEQPIELNLSGR